MSIELIKRIPYRILRISGTEYINKRLKMAKDKNPSLFDLENDWQKEWIWGY